MLVLNRRLRESIVIADNIVVTVVGIQGNSVRLAFEAPPEVSVHRSEVKERLLRKKNCEEPTCGSSAV
jgi:carbon storage regulator